MTNQGNTRRKGARFARLMLPALVAVGMAACDFDELLDVEDTEVASPSSVRDPSALPVVYAGVIRDFTWAYSGTGSVGGGGDNDPLILLSGLLTDEQRHYGTFPTRREIDLRDISVDGPNGTTDNGTLADAYHNLHRARRAAETGEALFDAADAGNTADRSVISSIAGYSYTLFGEIFCEGVPYSSIALDGTTTLGSASTRAETWGRAIEWFDRAIATAQAAGSDDALNLARVGKARVLLNQGQHGAAAAEVANVPDDFVYEIEHSANSSGENNGVFIFTLDNGRYGLEDNEGGNGLEWSSDPRTPVLVDTRAPFDTSIPIYIGQGKYDNRADAVALASGKEARLIRAEAALDDVVQFQTHLNAARAIDGVDPLALTDIPLTREGRVDLLFEERGYALWLTAHRLGDLRRMIRQYGRDQADVFPTGNYFRSGLTYGSDVNIPIFVDENNNPEFTGCLNRDA